MHVNKLKPYWAFIFQAEYSLLSKTYHLQFAGRNRVLPIFNEIMHSELASLSVYPALKASGFKLTRLARSVLWTYFPSYKTLLTSVVSSLLSCLLHPCWFIVFLCIFILWSNFSAVERTETNICSMWLSVWGFPMGASYLYILSFIWNPGKTHFVLVPFLSIESCFLFSWISFSPFFKINNNNNICHVEKLNISAFLNGSLAIEMPKLFMVGRISKMASQKCAALDPGTYEYD